MDLNKEIGQKIRHIRKHKMLTLSTVSLMSGISVSHLSEIERGLVGASLETGYKIARALGVNVSEILPDIPGSINGLECEDCGRPYASQGWVDLVIPDQQWAIIHPEGEGGILCAYCICRRLGGHGASAVLAWGDNLHKQRFS